jgi:hypothetical protein
MCDFNLIFGRGPPPCLRLESPCCPLRLSHYSASSTGVLGFLGQLDPFVGDFQAAVPQQLRRGSPGLLPAFFSCRTIAGHEVFFGFRRRHALRVGVRRPTALAACDIRIDCGDQMRVALG